MLDKIGLWREGLHLEFLAEGYPVFGETRGLQEGKERQLGAAVIGKIDAQLVGRIVISHG